nr:ATPase [uncultured Methanobrevibacter sp.]
MNMITILIWITIAIIAAIAIITVKLYFKGDELEHEEGSILPNTEDLNKALNIGKNKITSKNNSQTTNAPRSLSPNMPQHNNNHNLFRKNLGTESKNEAYIVPEVKNDNLQNYEYESQNQVLINYDNTVEKFQEPIKQNQMDIMTQNNNESSELKDLFTIDELIKESKRKDTEREKESQKIKKDEEDEELIEIKESIKNKTPEPLIEEVIDENNEEKISDIIGDEKDTVKSETPSVASQKDIDEAISTASKETEETVESISEDRDITDALLNPEKEEISEPTLKTPNKVVETTDYKLGASIDESDLFKDEEDDIMDLDYRKDLDKVKNKITSSKLFQDVKEKLNPEPVEEPPMTEELQNEYIRNVNEYEYEPIINETHVDIDDGTYEDYHNQKLRQENTRRVFNLAKNTPETQPDMGEIKSKPAMDNIKININNNEVVLKKGDEIIFNHDGETYSSQVYAIRGDDISVRYRRKDITIKPSDVKKIY